MQAQQRYLFGKNVSVLKIIHSYVFVISSFNLLCSEVCWNSSAGSMNVYEVMTGDIFFFSFYVSHPLAC
jgi:hypothetical protein